MKNGRRDSQGTMSLERGSRGLEPFSASGGNKNGVGPFRYRARSARDNTEMRSAPWNTSSCPFMRLSCGLWRGHAFSED